MISWTKLLTGQPQENDRLRYSHRDELVPRIVVWNSTSRCNLKCLHCYFEATQAQAPHEMSLKEAMNFIRDLADFRVPILLFSGGEPLLRKDIFRLGKFVKEKGMKPVLSTNGTLITKEVAKEIKDAGFVYVGISLDGMQASNDRLRQNDGAYASALTGLRHCRDIGLKTGIRFTLTKFNYKDLNDIFDIVERESIPRLCIYHLVYTGRGDKLKDDDLSHGSKRESLSLIWRRVVDFAKKDMNTEVLTVDNYADGAWIYLKLRNKYPQRAKEVLELLKAQGGDGSGSRIGAVDNFGNIYADQFWRKHPLGNIRKTRFSEVWRGKDNEFLQVLRNRKYLLKERCRSCGFLEICNGNFRARAEAVFNDPWAEDPGCYLTEEEIYGY